MSNSIPIHLKIKPLILIDYEEVFQVSDSPEKRKLRLVGKIDDNVLYTLWPNALVLPEKAP